MTDAYAMAETARRQANGLHFAVVVEVDLETRRAVVEIEDGWTLAPLPWLERRAGLVRTSSAPSVGEQVAVISPAGETAAGLILLGVPSDAFAVSAARDGLDLVETEGGFREAWDEEAKRRFIDLPEGGELVISAAGVQLVHVTAEEAVLTIGGAAASVKDGEVKLSSGSAAILIEGGEITLDGKVNLGGKGGQPVARLNDAISTQTSRIIAGSDDVRSK